MKLPPRLEFPAPPARFALPGRPAPPDRLPPKRFPPPERFGPLPKRFGLEADNLAESLYRGLMRALASNGDRAEALTAFRRCRELLSIVLGVKPAAETERLYRQISGS